MSDKERLTDNSRESKVEQVIPVVVVPITNLTAHSVMELIAIYQRIFKRGSQDGEGLLQANYVISELSDKGTGYPEIRYGAQIGDFFNPHSKFRARRCNLVRSNDTIDETAKFYFDSNLEPSIPREKALVELAEELKIKFALETGKRLLQLGIGVIPQNDEFII